MNRGCHTSSLVKTAAVPFAVGALAMLGLALRTASAGQIIYQDSFNGSSTTPLNGSAPTVDNGTSTAWTASGGSSAFADSGYTSESGNAGAEAYLNFTPVSGNIYTLSATLYMNVLDQANPSYNWLAVGFVMNPDTANGASFVFGKTNPGAYAFMQVFKPGVVPMTGGYAATEGYSGPDGADSPYISDFLAPAGTAADGPQQASIVLNTGASAWTYQFFDNGIAVSPVETFQSNPAITAVGLNLQGPGDGSGSLVTGQVSSFELTSSPVPEPATLDMVAIGGLTLMLLKRRHRLGVG